MTGNTRTQTHRLNVNQLKGALTVSCMAKQTSGVGDSSFAPWTTSVLLFSPDVGRNIKISEFEYLRSVPLIIYAWKSSNVYVRTCFNPRITNRSFWQLQKKQTLRSEWSSFLLQHTHVCVGSTVEIINSVLPVSSLNIQSVFAEAVVHLNLLGAPPLPRCYYWTGGVSKVQGCVGNLCSGGRVGSSAR